MQRLISLIFLLLAAYTSPAVALQWTNSELRAAPGYCQARYVDGKTSESWKQWEKVMGPASLHMHHYCDGLLWINRYYGSGDRREKKRILQSAYGSFMYMVPRVDSSWPLLPELYLNLGTVMALQNRDGEALQAMLKAIQLDPKMTKAYSATANQYVKLKKKEDALKVVTEGLRQVPGDEGLQKLYISLGGELPYPEPVVEQAKQPPETASAKPAGESGDVATQSTESPNIGSPSNPWCRFCPPEPSQ